MVSSESSKGEIERTLTRYGATQFMSGWKEQMAMVGFQMKDKVLRFVLPMPDRQADEFWMTPSGRSRRDRNNGEVQAAEAYEQAIRQRWRALALVVKAKLEAVECGITTFEEEFMAHIVIPGTGKTVAEHMLHKIEKAYKTGEVPALGWDSSK